MSHLILIIFIAKADLLATCALGVLIAIPVVFCERHPVITRPVKTFFLLLIVVTLLVDDIRLNSARSERHGTTKLVLGRRFRLKPASQGNKHLRYWCERAERFSILYWNRRVLVLSVLYSSLFACNF